jgi:hypothetical protein
MKNDGKIEIAREQVEAFMEILRSQYGLSDSDLHEFVLLFLRLRKRTKFAEALGEWTAKTVITVLVTAFFSGITWAFVHFIELLSKKI